MGKKLVIGSSGQIGVELIEQLAKDFGPNQVIAADIKLVSEGKTLGIEYITLDVLDKEKLFEIIKQHNISEVYLLAAMLSAIAEKNIQLAWNLNMKGLFNILDLAKEKHIEKIFWPSSIAVFGPTSPKLNTPQSTLLEPSTVYGISKMSGERWCEYYYNQYQIDVVSLRYPGLIGWKSQPGGGTTDYAVEIFHEAIKNKSYNCFLKKDTTLPMMYMSDAINATLNIMQANADKIKIRSSYNIAGTSFCPNELYDEIKIHIPEFSITYTPDFRQKIADSWPDSLDDSLAKKHWNWKAKYDLKKMTVDMLKNLKKANQIK